MIGRNEPERLLPDDIDQMLDGSDYGSADIKNIDSPIPVRYSNAHTLIPPRTLASPRAIDKITKEMQEQHTIPTWMQIVGKLVVVITLGLGCWFSYEAIRLYFVNNDWNHIPFIKDEMKDIVNKIIMAGHLCSWIMTMILGAILILMHKWTPLNLHKIFGTIYFLMAMINGWLSISYIILNDTIGGLWMRVAFGIYGICVLTASGMVFITGHLNSSVAKFKLGTHFEWILRSYAFSMGSFWYRALYMISMLFGYNASTVEDFQRPLDMSFDYLFFIPSAILVELVLVIVRSQYTETSPYIYYW